MLNPDGPLKNPRYAFGALAGDVTRVTPTSELRCYRDRTSHEEIGDWRYRMAGSRDLCVASRVCMDPCAQLATKAWSQAISPVRIGPATANLMTSALSEGAIVMAGRRFSRPWRQGVQPGV
jgi:hypothetical protein